MNMFDKILLSPLINLDRNIFIKSYSILSFNQKKIINDKILQDKLSPIFLSYIKKNKLENLFYKDHLNDIVVQFRRLQIQNLEVIKEVILLKKLFVKENLYPVFLKGVPLINDYTDLSLRPMVDIDILFDSTDSLRAFELLKKNNYKELRYKSQNIQKLKKFSKNVHHLPELVGMSKISIEIHHRLTKKVHFKDCPFTKKVLQNKKTIDFYGENINVPSTEDRVIHQLIHFSLNSNFKKQLRVFSDIYQIEKNNKLCWNKVFNKSYNKELKMQLALSLEVINYSIPIIKNFSSLKSEYKIFFPKNNKASVLYNDIFKIHKNNFFQNNIYRLKILKSLIKSRNLVEIFQLLFDWIIFKLDPSFKVVNK